MTIKIFGIKNCDTIKKALKWLAAEGIDHHYHDFRKDGLDESLVGQFLSVLPANELVNKRGTTWRNLPSETQNLIDRGCQKTVVETIVNNPALIKRPVWLYGDEIFTGFKAAEMQRVKEL